MSHYHLRTKVALDLVDHVVDPSDALVTFLFLAGQYGRTLSPSVTPVESIRRFWRASTRSLASCPLLRAARSRSSGAAAATICTLRLATLLFQRCSRGPRLFFQAASCVSKSCLVATIFLLRSSRRLHACCSTTGPNLFTCLDLESYIYCIVCRLCEINEGRIWHSHFHFVIFSPPPSSSRQVGLQGLHYRWCEQIYTCLHYRLIHYPLMENYSFTM
jgi:hypothetical protein